MSHCSQEGWARAMWTSHSGIVIKTARCNKVVRALRCKLMRVEVGRLAALACSRLQVGGRSWGRGDRDSRSQQRHRWVVDGYVTRGEEISLQHRPRRRSGRCPRGRCRCAALIEREIGTTHVEPCLWRMHHNADRCKLRDKGTQTVPHASCGAS